MIKRASKKVVEKSSNQGMLLLQPYLAMGLVEALSVLLKIIGDRTGFVEEIAFALSASTIILSYFIWKTSQHRRDFGRIHAVATMVLAGGYSIASLLISPFDPTIFLLWLVGGITIGLSWNIRQAVRSESRDDPVDIFLAENGLAGTKLKFTKRGRDVTEGTVKLKPGTPLETFQKAQSRLASFFGVPANGVRITPDMENSSKAFLKIVRRDLLRDVIKYEYKPEVLTPDDPIEIGRYEDGTKEEFSLHSPALGAVHLLVQGMNGSGKSEAAKVIFAEAFKRTETEMWVIDTTKGDQTLGVVKDYLDWVITDEKIADLLFKKFPRVIKARANYLGSKRLNKWKPGCGLSFIYMHIEEASGLIANNPAFIKMMETARSVGIQLTASLQRASHVAVDTAARAQFSSVLCFGVQDIADAQFALPDEVIDSGANPAIWKNKKQGYNYLVHPDADDEYWNTPARTKLIEDSVLQIAGENRLPHELDHVTLNALGDLYQAELDADPNNDEEELDELYPEEEREQVEEDLEELKSEYNTVLDFKKPEELSAEEAKQVFEEKLEDLRSYGEEFEAPKLTDVLLRTGKSRAWLYKQLMAKVESGELEKEDATYKFPPRLKKKEG